MTKDKDEKAVIRARMSRTGESYAAARAQLSRGGPQEPPAGPSTSHSFVATEAVSAALKQASAYGAGVWALLLALRAGDGTAAHVLEGLGLELVHPQQGGAIEQAAAGHLKAVLPPAVLMAQAEGKTVLDSALLLRAAVSVLESSDVPSARGRLLGALKAADLAALCAQAENMHGSEQPKTDANGNERTGMFERFTDKARRVVVMAQEHARALDHNYIGTEHVLLGLLAVDDAVAARVLTSLGVSLDAAAAQVEGLIGRGTEPPSGHIPFTPRAKTTLEQSLRAALELNHNYIGTEHILLGLMAVPEGVAGTVLFKLPGVTSETVRAKVIEVLEQHGTPDGDA